MTRLLPRSVPRFTLSALSLALLAGCSSLGISEDKVDYRSQSKQTSGLDVPPDLSQLQRQSPLGTASISAAALATQAGAPAAAPGGPAVALNKVGTAEIVRVGSTRVIRTSQTPEQVWPVARSFWMDLGFDLPKDMAEAGVLETDWKENRAKLPKDLIRRTIGTLIEGLYSTGERDLFRTRIERVDGQTEITLTHRGMQEIYTSSQRDQTTWTARPSDAELEAEMLNRLLLRLGGVAPSAATAAATPSSTLPTAAPTEGAKLVLANVPNELVLAEDFERAWRRVGQSLDRHGFTVEDRDRRAGLFFLRYADPTLAGKEEPNFFQKLFSSTPDNSGTGRYRVSVKSEGQRSTIRVQDPQGTQMTDDNAKRILGLLQQDLR